MSFLSRLMGKSAKSHAAPVSPQRATQPGSTQQASSDLHALADQFGTADPLATDQPLPPVGSAESKVQAIFDAERRAAPDSSALNIWDLEEDASAEADAPSQVAQDPQPDAAPAAASDEASRPVPRSRRNRTRIIGFENSGSEIVDLFEAKNEPTPKNDVVFPVGWLLVTEGPGRGHCFSLFAGMAQIGRGEDQSIQLDFGDMAISRNNHAAIVFDNEDRNFVLGHGGKANIVRLNGKPLVSNTEMKEGDEIKIGETTLQLKVLCGPDFDWTIDETPAEEDDEDVAIA